MINCCWNRGEEIERLVPFTGGDLPATPEHEERVGDFEGPHLSIVLAMDG